MARPSITQLPPTGLDRFRGLLTRADDLTGGLLAAVPGIGTLAALNRSGNAAQTGNYTKAVESLTDVVPVGRLATRAIKGLTKGRSTGDVGGLLNIRAPQQDALDLAQKRAALPVSEGGLGLPPNNTPMQRAEAMKGKPGFHFSRTGADVTELDSGKYAVSPFDAIGTHIGSKEAAQQRFENTARYSDTPKGVTYPVMMLGDKELLSKSGKPMTELELIDDLIARGAWGDKDYKTQNADLRQKYFSEYDRIPYVNDVEDAGNVSYIVPPQNLRSIHAAFDPFRRNEADLLAFSGNMGGTTLGNINPLLGLLDDENQ